MGMVCNSLSAGRTYAYGLKNVQGSQICSRLCAEKGMRALMPAHRFPGMYKYPGQCGSVFGVARRLEPRVPISLHSENWLFRAISSWVQDLGGLDLSLGGPRVETPKRRFRVNAGFSNSCHSGPTILMTERHPPPGQLAYGVQEATKTMIAVPSP